MKSKRIRHTYTMIDAVDRNVGKLVDELESSGLMENTIIVFASDHRELLVNHGLWLKEPFFYEGLINTPLLMYVPDYGCRKSRQLISAIDLVLTVYELLGIETPSHADGVSQ